MDHENPMLYINKGHNYLNHIGLALGNLKEYQDSIKMYDRALQIDPQDFNSYLYKGI